MLKTAQTIVLFLLFIVTAPTYANDLYIVESIEDGDTIIVIMPGQKGTVKIQLSGIDAPEDTDNAKLKYDIQKTSLNRQQLLSIGRAATDHLNSLISPKTIVALDVDPGKVDRYGRIPAILYYPDNSTRSINEQMIAQGYSRYLETDGLDISFSENLRKVQQQAIDQKLGIWGEYKQIADRWSGRQ